MCTCTTGRRTARRVCRLPGWGWRERASLWVGLPHVSRLEDFCVPQAKPNGVPQLARAIRIDISEFNFPKCSPLHRSSVCDDRAFREKKQLHTSQVPQASTTA
jgi:hypothetical protein